MAGCQAFCFLGIAKILRSDEYLEIKHTVGNAIMQPFSACQGLFQALRACPHGADSSRENRSKTMHKYVHIFIHIYSIYFKYLLICYTLQIFIQTNYIYSNYIYITFMHLLYITYTYITCNIYICVYMYKTCQVVSVIKKLRAWPGSPIGQSAVLIGQNCGFDPQSWHVQEASNECINKWNNK